MEKSTVMITGASGLLGRALMTKFTSTEAWKNVVGTAFSRCGPNLLQVDLTDLDQIKARITVSSGSDNKHKYPLRKYILEVLTHTIA